MPNLLSEINIKNHTIKNRIVMPPMVCFGWSGDDGLVTGKHIAHYEARAKGGVGLIILEAHCVNKDGRLADTQLGIWSDSHIQGLNRLAEACHRYGAKVLVQIHHAGLHTAKTVSNIALAPSAGEDENGRVRELSLQEIRQIQEDFINAAVRAEKAGLDGIELHGAHGYLISQFASPVTNRRRDEFGSSFQGRMKFVTEIIEKIKAAVGNSFILGYRMGGNEPALEDGIRIARELEVRGIDLLHVSAGISGGETPKPPQDFKHSRIVYCGTEIKKHVGLPVIVVNGIRTPEQAASLIETGLADFTAVGKGLLADPSWAEKAGAGTPVEVCLQCVKCQWFTNGDKCPKNNIIK